MLADGSKVEADVVVLARGYHNTLTSAQKTLGDEGEIRTMNGFLSSVLLLLLDAERYRMNHCLLIEGLSEVEAERSPSLLVHGLESCCVSDLLPHAGHADSRLLGKGVISKR